MLPTGSASIDAERAFALQSRSRRRAALARRLRGRPADCGRLRVLDERRHGAAARALGASVREIPLDSITGTLEPSRAALFDGDFRPAPKARTRWERVWLAEHRGAPLPPISVVPTDDGYAVRDGHHRISVARARGALSIDAVIDRAAA